MAKVTLHGNLFPCARPVSDDVSSLDLVENLELADRLARIASQVFWLKRGCGRFSGFVSESEGPFSIEVWWRGRMVRALRFPALGYSGILFVDIEERLSVAMGTDILGDLYATEGVDKDELEGLEMTFEGVRDMPSLKTQSKKADRHFMTLKRMRESREKVVMRILDYLEAT